MRYRMVALVVAAAVMFLGMCTGAFPVDAIFELLLGWFSFLRRNLPRVSVRWEMLLTAVGYFAAFVAGAHLFMRWLWREARKRAPEALGAWRARWTLCAATSFLLLFVIGTATWGLVNQTSRLATSEERVWVSRLGKIHCRHNLQQIGSWLLQHIHDNDGRYPDDLTVLLADDQLSPHSFICPDRDDMPATGDTAEQRMARFRKGGCCSYVYLAAGRKDVGGDEAAMYEPPGNHEFQFVHVLYGSGRADRISVEEARRLIPGLKDHP